MGAQRDRNGRVDPRQLLDGDRVLQRRPTGTANVLGERDTHPAERAHLRDQLIWEGLRAVELARDRSNLRASELTDRPLEQNRVVVEIEMHRR